MSYISPVDLSLDKNFEKEERNVIECCAEVKEGGSFAKKVMKIISVSTKKLRIVDMMGKIEKTIDVGDIKMAEIKKISNDRHVVKLEIFSKKKESSMNLSVKNGPRLVSTIHAVQDSLTHKYDKKFRIQKYNKMFQFVDCELRVCRSTIVYVRGKKRRTFSIGNITGLHFHDKQRSFLIIKFEGFRVHFLKTNDINSIIETITFQAKKQLNLVLNTTTLSDVEYNQIRERSFLPQSHNFFSSYNVKRIKPQPMPFDEVREEVEKDSKDKDSHYEKENAANIDPQAIIKRERKIFMNERYFVEKDKDVVMNVHEICDIERVVIPQPSKISGKSANRTISIEFDHESERYTYKFANTVMRDAFLCDLCEMAKLNNNKRPLCFDYLIKESKMDSDPLYLRHHVIPMMTIVNEQNYLQSLYLFAHFNNQFNCMFTSQSKLNKRSMVLENVLSLLEYVLENCDEDGPSLTTIMPLLLAIDKLVSFGSSPTDISSVKELFLNTVIRCMLAFKWSLVKFVSSRILMSLLCIPSGVSSSYERTIKGNRETVFTSSNVIYIIESLIWHGTNPALALYHLHLFHIFRNVLATTTVSNSTMSSPILSSLPSPSQTTLTPSSSSSSSSNSNNSLNSSLNSSSNSSNSSNSAQPTPMTPSLFCALLCYLLVHLRAMLISVCASSAANTPQSLRHVAVRLIVSLALRLKPKDLRLVQRDCLESGAILRVLYDALFIPRLWKTSNSDPNNQSQQDSSSSEGGNSGSSEFSTGDNLGDGQEIFGSEGYAGWMFEGASDDTRGSKGWTFGVVRDSLVFVDVMTSQFSDSQKLLKKCFPFYLSVPYIISSSFGLNSSNNNSSSSNNNSLNSSSSNNSSNSSSNNRESGSLSPITGIGMMEGSPAPQTPGGSSGTLRKMFGGIFGSSNSTSDDYVPLKLNANFLYGGWDASTADGNDNGGAFVPLTESGSTNLTSSNGCEGWAVVVECARRSVAVQTSHAVWDLTLLGALRSTLRKELGHIDKFSRRNRMEGEGIQWNHHEFVFDVTKVSPHLKVGNVFLKFLIQKDDKKKEITKEALKDFKENESLKNSSSEKGNDNSSSNNNSNNNAFSRDLLMKNEDAQFFLKQICYSYFFEKDFNKKLLLLQSMNYVYNQQKTSSVFPYLRKIVQMTLTQTKETKDSNNNSNKDKENNNQLFLCMLSLLSTCLQNSRENVVSVQDVLSPLLLPFLKRVHVDHLDDIICASLDVLLIAVKHRSIALTGKECPYPLSSLIVSLSSDDCLPYLSQLLLSKNSQIYNKAINIIYNLMYVMRSDASVIQNIHQTGLFYFIFSSEFPMTFETAQLLKILKIQKINKKDFFPNWKKVEKKDEQPKKEEEKIKEKSQRGEKTPEKAQTKKEEDKRSESLKLEKKTPEPSSPNSSSLIGISLKEPSFLEAFLPSFLVASLDEKEEQFVSLFNANSENWDDKRRARLADLLQRHILEFSTSCLTNHLLKYSNQFKPFKAISYN